MKNESIEFTRVNNDTNGNPRYVCHFLNLLTNSQEKDRQDFDLTNRYNLALANSRQFGGRKFHNKQYGGGIVFQSYYIEGLEKKILEFTNNN